MIKITALYRWREGASFDHDYYLFSDLKQAQTAARQTAAELTADIPNYTNITPESYFAQMLQHEVSAA